MSNLITSGYYSALKNRKIREETCRKFSYQLAEQNGKPVHVAPYRDQAGQLVGQKIRAAGKQFYTTGDMTDVQLFGQHLWTNKGGKRIVVTEGEIDCLAYHQVNPTWPVVSIPSGAQSSPKAIIRNIEFLEGYQEVVFMFDNDQAGAEAAQKCADLITPGKAAIATTVLKDAGEMLIAGRVKELIKCVYDAKTQRPDGVVNAKELWDDINKDIDMGAPYPFPTWNSVLYGLRERELLVLTAGSGVGKSTISAQLAYDLAVNQEQPVAYIALEESVSRTALRFMSLAAKKPLHLPNDLTEAQRKTAFDQSLGHGRVTLFDHFGSADSDHLLAKMRYMVVALGAKFVVLDHLSILLSGADFMVSNTGSERQQIDYTMSKLRQFSEQYGCSIILISHLRRAGGDKGFEDGAEPTLSSLRGSQSVAQLADTVVAVSRDASGGEDILKVACLKNRYVGITGPMGHLVYDHDTATLYEANPDNLENVTDF